MSKTVRRLALAEAQGWRCVHCGQPMRYDGNHPDGATIEHVIPLAFGGQRVWGNEVAAHQRCNHARGHKPLDMDSETIARSFLTLAVQDRIVAARRMAIRHATTALRELEAVHDLLAPFADQDEASAAMIAAAGRATRGVVDTIGAVPSKPARKPGVSERLSRGVRRAWIRLGLIVQAVRAANRIETPDDSADLHIAVTTVPNRKACEADWRRRFGAAFQRHQEARPGQLSLRAWRAAFYRSHPAAAEHPGRATK
ncbi:HNH endonuclease [Azospirillum doebereinerae]